MSRRKLSRQKIKAAIVNSGGVVAVIARRSGYTWGAVKKFIDADDELRQMFDDEQNTISDAAEGNLITAIKSGETGVSMWWLSHIRRDRFGGTSDAPNNNEPIRIVVEYYDADPKD